MLMKSPPIVIIRLLWELLVIIIVRYTAFCDPGPLRMNLMRHMELSNRTQLPRIHGPDSNSTAYLFHNGGASERTVQVHPPTVADLLQQLGQSSEFTIWTMVRQDEGSGTIFAILDGNVKLLELESSGHRDEIRVHYASISPPAVATPSTVSPTQMHSYQSPPDNTKSSSRGRTPHSSTSPQTEDYTSHTEVFPYRLSDARWHAIALSFSEDFLELYIDCELVYSRPLVGFSHYLFSHYSQQTSDITMMLGQRNNRHTYFEGAIQYVKFSFKPQGVLDQCPHANVACPTCSEFNQVQQNIANLYSMIEMLNRKLMESNEHIVELQSQVTHLSHLEECECHRSCEYDGTIYRDGDVMKSGCETYRCIGGNMTKMEADCPVLDCRHPVQVEGECCKTCKRSCPGYNLEHGESYAHSSCVTCKCNDSQVECKDMRNSCPVLNCPRRKQKRPRGGCCKICKGTDFCSLDNNCDANATCTNLSNRHMCRCNSGFRGDDGTSCRDIDECTEGTASCDSNSTCINTVGSYMCQCKEGFIHPPGLQQTCIEHNLCISGEHQCHHHATCVHTSMQPYTCSCNPGYHGDGYHCRPICNPECENGGICISPSKCSCRKGFAGRNCEDDIDECARNMDRCHHNSICINTLGSYTCQCRPGFFDSEYPTSNYGANCHDLNECQGYGGGSQCPSDTQCRNTLGGYECRCVQGEACTGGCEYDGRRYGDGTQWYPENNHCSICECQHGRSQCTPRICDCTQAAVDLTCCPQCDRHLQCTHHEDNNSIHHSGDRWQYECQICECHEGEIDCYRPSCPVLDCRNTVHLEGDCCPSCAVEDPCHSLALRAAHPSESREAMADYMPDGCEFNGKLHRHGARWFMRWDLCTMCECYDGHVCCLYDQVCELRNQLSDQTPDQLANELTNELTEELTDERLETDLNNNGPQPYWRRRG